MKDVLRAILIDFLFLFISLIFIANKMYLFSILPIVLMFYFIGYRDKKRREKNKQNDIMSKINEQKIRDRANHKRESKLLVGQKGINSSVYTKKRVDTKASEQKKIESLQRRVHEVSMHKNSDVGQRRAQGILSQDKKDDLQQDVQEISSQEKMEAIQRKIKRDKDRMAFEKRKAAEALDWEKYAIECNARLNLKDAMQEYKEDDRYKDFM